VIAAILMSSFIAAEISRGEPPGPALRQLTSPASPVPASGKVVVLPPVPGPPKSAPRRKPAAGLAGGAAYSWRLAWSAEFNGPGGSPPDPASWSYDTGGNGWGNSELEYYTTSTANAALDGHGHLVITARDTGTAGLSCWYGPCRYTSARLVTLGHFSQAYGQISARIKLPGGSGIWPSFWALGDNFATAGWPQTGQINIMSFPGSTPATVSFGLIGPGYTQWSGDTLASGTFTSAYHTFTVDWYPDHASFYVDGHLYDTQYAAQAGSGWVFDHPFFLILNLAVGGTQPGSPAATTFPQQMLVDWIRVYTAGPPPAPVTGPVTGPDGKCATAASDGAVQLGTCDGSPAQTWTMDTDGTVRALGQCLGLTADGTATQLAGCDASPAQQWQAQTNGQLASTSSGRCLDATGGVSLLQISDCAGTPSQLWTLP
jgi:beta-glucanase (GH16 family)